MRLWPAGVILDFVIMIGRWSEPSSRSALQDVVGARLGVQKVMSGDDGVKRAWWGTLVWL